MNLLYGKEIADEVTTDLKLKIKELGITPGLGVILVGEDEASRLYVSIKEKLAKEVGFYFKKIELSGESKTEDVIFEIEKLNSDDLVHGIIVQMPLPEGLNEMAIVESIHSSKDADGFHKKTIAKLMSGDASIVPVFPSAVIELLKSTGENLDNKKATLLVNSTHFGEVLGKSLSFVGVKSEIVLSDTENLQDKTCQADILITAVGRPNFITADFIKNGAIVIDGGITRVNGKTFGDVDVKSVGNKASFISPVPGGVGPLTVAFLLKRVFELASGER